MNDGIRVFLDKGIENIIKKEADAEHVSPGQYCCNGCNKNCRHFSFTPSYKYRFLRREIIGHVAAKT